MKKGCFPLKEASPAQSKAPSYASSAEHRTLVYMELRQSPSRGCRTVNYTHRAGKDGPKAIPGLMRERPPPGNCDVERADRDAMNRSNPEIASLIEVEIAGHELHFPEYHPPSLREESARLLKTAAETVLKVVFGRRVMVRRGKRRAKVLHPRARKRQTAAKTAGKAIADEPATERERRILNAAIAWSLIDRRHRHVACSCSCGTLDHSESSCKRGLQ